jgi:hypothetical protein
MDYKNVSESLQNLERFIENKHRGNRTEKEGKELKSMKAQKYLGVEESHNVEHKNEGRKVEE